MASNTGLDPIDSHEIADAWAGQSAGPALYTRGEDQFVAFYAGDRSITVGQRRLGETDWTLTCLTGERNDAWDHHNSLSLAVDAEGCLHLAGDMHGDPLNYFRTTDPLEVTSFDRVASMIGSEENSVTYASFLQGPDDELIFTYRQGKSGAGDWIYNRYDPKTRGWDRLLQEPLIRGGERANPYPTGPTPGPDGYYHLVWCWRDTPAAQTNHDLYYVRSEDLRHWETSHGNDVPVPIGFHGGELVDPVAPYGGLLNSRIYLGFDARDRVVVSYMKFDPDGNTQVYNARRETEGWTIHETSDWDYRYAFGGTGSLGTPLRFSGVQVETDGRLSQTYDHPKYGTGKWILDEETLQPVEWLSPWHRYPPDLETVRSEHPHLRVNWVRDAGASPAGEEFALRWEALDPQTGGDTDVGDAEEAVQRLERAAVDIDEGALENISVYDYGTATERLHAKTLVADGEQAYIGSANLTSYSLQEAIEIGVIVDGPVVEDINAFLTEVRELDATDLVL